MNSMVEMIRRYDEEVGEILRPIIDHHKLGNSTVPPATLPKATYYPLRQLFGVTSMALAREPYTTDIGWFLLTTEVKEHLAKLLQNEVVLEVGCGTGFLAHHLMAAGVKDYTAIDKREPEWWGEGNIFFAGEEGDATKADLSRYSVIICCWPPLGGTYWEAVLRNMKPGQSFLYQGEGEGGCCGSDAGWMYLEEHFVDRSAEIDHINADHIQFCGYHDKWQLFTKEKE